MAGKDKRVDIVALGNREECYIIEEAFVLEIPLYNKH
jgi:hypothetical protein